MSTELETLDTYIDSLKTDLDKSSALREIKPKFTLDIIPELDKIKCFKNYDILDKCLYFQYPRDEVEPFIIQIKFKNEVIDLEKLFNVCVINSLDNYHMCSLRLLIINSILNNICIIDGSNLYFINTNFPLICENINNISESIIDDVWVYKNYKTIIIFTPKYYIKSPTFSHHSFVFKKNMGLIINFEQIDETRIIPSISYIIFEYNFEIRQIEFEKKTRIDILPKYKLNITGNYYWIKNIFQFDELIEKSRIFYNCCFYLYSDLGEEICKFYKINSYFVYKF
jgi:hypothetical protein